MNSLVNILLDHQALEPTGGTASIASCSCTCGYMVSVPGVTRDYAKQLLFGHIAEVITNITNDTLAKAISHHDHVWPKGPPWDSMSDTYKQGTINFITSRSKNVP